MIHTNSIDTTTLKDVCLTIGIFDGVHRGHQELLRGLTDLAHQASLPAVVLTFEPHPAIVLGGRVDFRYLTSSEEKLALLEGCRVDAVITLPFNREFANQTAGDFLQQLKRSLGLRNLFIGHDTALGKGRLGDAKSLEKIGEELGFAITVVPPLLNEEGVISSTRIRKSIAAGQVAEAAKDLGRYYDLHGTVVHGDGRGRKINIPTANINMPSGKVLPANGIYACRAWLSEGNEENKVMFAAATNVGIRPTFTPDLLIPVIEAHLLDFEGNLYDRQIRLEFVEYLRPEEKYRSVDALVKQIQSDIESTRKIISG